MNSCCEPLSNPQTFVCEKNTQKMLLPNCECVCMYMCLCVCVCVCVHLLEECLPTFKKNLPYERWLVAARASA